MRDLNLDIPESGICLVSLSNNSDHQHALYSMYMALRDAGYKVYTVGADDPVATTACNDPQNLYVDCPDRPGIAKGTFNLAKANAFVGAIRSTGCRTIYFESVHIWNCYALACLGSEYTRITTLHDVVPHDGSRSVLVCQKLQSSLSDYVVIKSPEFLNDAQRLYGLRSDQVLTIGVWRDWLEYSPLTGDGSFLFFGRLRKYKGLPAMMEIVESCPEIRFVVMGSPDELSRPMVEQIKRFPNVRVIDREVNDDEMESAFKKASWVLLPYESASQSGVVIDACKFSRPSIAFEVGAVSSQIVDGKTGFLVPAGDVPAFVESVRRASTLPIDDHSKMCRAAHEFGKKRYSANGIAFDFANVFRVARVEADGGLTQ